MRQKELIVEEIRTFGPTETSVINRRLIKNSTANLISGASSAALALAVPPVLSRYLSLEMFAVWALILQVASYTSLLNFGIQSAVGRYVAVAMEKADWPLASRVASTALAMLLTAGLVGFVVISVIACFLPWLFPSVPAELAGSGRAVLCVVGFTLAFGLPFTTYNGVFTGLQRNEIPAAIIGGSRLILALILVAVCVQYRALLPMAIAFAMVNLLSYALQWYAHRRLAGNIRIHRGSVDGSAFHDLYSYSSSFMVWTVAMFMVNGLDTALVGRFDFHAVAVYASCVSVITFFSGIQQALFSPLIQVAAQMDARGDKQGLGRLLAKSTKISAFILLLSGSFVVLFAPELIRLWLGADFVATGVPILILLIVGNCIRLMAVPLSIFMLATDQHKRARLGPLLEGVSNLSAAIVCGLYFGAVGVAIGVIAGAIVGQLFNYFVNLKIISDRIAVKKTELFSRDTMLTIVIFSPCLLIAFISPFVGRLDLSIEVSIYVLSLILWSVFRKINKSIIKSENDLQ